MIRIWPRRGSESRPRQPQRPEIRSATRLKLRTNQHQKLQVLGVRELCESELKPVQQVPLGFRQTTYDLCNLVPVRLVHDFSPSAASVKHMTVPYFAARTAENPARFEPACGLMAGGGPENRDDLAQVEERESEDL
jgi:hypothetical protein